MFNILIAEDEENISLALEAIIKKEIPAAKTQIAINGADAYALFKESEIDLVLSDWNMPLMTGSELLNKIRSGSKNSDVPFLMLTARVDTESVQAAIGSQVSGYVAKPFDKGALVKKINYFLNKVNTVANSDVFENPSKKLSLYDQIKNLVEIRIKKDYLSFPILSELGIKSIDIVSHMDNSLENVVKVFKTEPAMSAKVMSVANSNYYRGQSKIETIEAAIARIGLKEMSNIVLSHAFSDMFKTQDETFDRRLRLLWEHSLTSAVIAKMICKLLERVNVEKIYAAALFHDIGKLLLIPIAYELKKKRGNITEKNIDSILSDLHIPAGLVLLKNWGFTKYFTDVIKYHHHIHDLEEIDFDCRCVMLANELSKEIAINKENANLKTAVINNLCQSICLDQDRLSHLLTESEEEILHVKSFIKFGK